ncbi:damage-inducible protein DinB [Solitalea longa]|uniref:Damage-inducible protein DinB n=1 Tax=Solitalea longa TaxID=2079460 RepID=A0A2S5A3L7_9SPHI|nr:DinB family protein [Solitalea longa]POY37168.1 damage-inducible protein DinB [Solitalea longa]
MDIFSKQYELVKGSRGVVLNYCAQMSPEHLNNAVPNFGQGTIKATLLHISNTYISWLSKFSLQKDEYFPSPEEVNGLEDIIKQFERANQAVTVFLTSFSDSDTLISGLKHGVDLNLSVTELFTHVTTHEFHHKGQIMSMGRILGYTPPDADIIRF